MLGNFCAATIVPEWKLRTDRKREKATTKTAKLTKAHIENIIILFFIKPPLSASFIPNLPTVIRVRKNFIALVYHKIYRLCRFLNENRIKNI